MYQLSKLEGQVKPGERPPSGLKEKVLRLAGRNPRPTNQAIADAVKEAFGVKVVERTIRRYCKVAGVATSSRRKLPGGVPDPELGPHGRELLHLGQRVRDRIALPGPLNVVRSVANPKLWTGESFSSEPIDQEEASVARDWGYGNVDATENPLFESLRQHLLGNRPWVELRALQDAYSRYCTLCRETYSQIVDLATACPTLAKEEARVAAEALLAWTYHLKVRKQPLFAAMAVPSNVDGFPGWQVVLGAWYITRSTKEKADAVAGTFDSLCQQALDFTSLDSLAKAENEVRLKVEAFKSNLQTDAYLRKLIRNGHCELCL